MLSDDLRTRLERLNRQPLSAMPPEVPQPGLAKPSAPADSRLPALPIPEPSGRTSDLPAGRETRNGAGVHWRIERTLESLWPDGVRFVADHRRTLASRVAESACSDDADVPATFAAHFPRRTAFLDLETCGFAGSMVFLAGVLHDDGDGLILSQLFARNYAEESGVLQSLWDLLAGRRVLVTFNGKSFDWPQVMDRSILYRLADEDRRGSLVQFDLLHHSRRRWGRGLPDCKLQTLERHVCGRARTGDIPGRDIPETYHEYVRTGDAWPMRNILHHNALDLITLLQLALCIFHHP